jgi:hypothetical protein
MVAANRTALYPLVAQASACVYFQAFDFIVHHKTWSLFFVLSQADACAIYPLGANVGEKKSCEGERV